MKKGQIKKPPIGLIPKAIHDYKRLSSIRGAITRYYNADLPIPIKWVKEYNELILKLN